MNIDLVRSYLGLADDTNEITFSDYVFLRLTFYGVHKVFGVSGGGIMHLLDSVYRNTNVSFLPFHHESHAGFAADAYVKLTGRLACVVATTGPGAANVMPSMVSAWQDSVPILFLTGQCKTSDSTEYSQAHYLRTLGPAEFNVVNPAKHFTKFSSLVRSVTSGFDTLEEALFMLKSGRYGPCLLDIPLDIQGSKLAIDLASAKLCQALESSHAFPNSTRSSDLQLFSETISRSEIVSDLNKSSCPLILLGSGIERASMSDDYLDLLSRCRIPYVCSASTKSLASQKLAYYLGSPGIRGNRSANIAIDQADLLIVIGSSLHPQVCGWDPKTFAPKATIIYIDIDKDQLNFKKQQYDIKHAHCLSVQAFFDFMQSFLLEEDHLLASEYWLSYCSYLKTNFLIESLYDKSEGLSYYEVVGVLNDVVTSDRFSCVISDAGTSWYVVGQYFHPHEPVPLVTSASFGGMGYAIPALVGSTVASDKLCIAVTGDGSAHMSIQEFATLSNLNVPCILIIVNNNGYMSIRNTQNRYCEGRLVGTDTSNGVFIPSYKKLCEAYSIKYIYVNNCVELRHHLQQEISKPTVIEVKVVEDEKLLPAAVSTLNEETGQFLFSGLSNMTPSVSYLNYEQFLCSLD